MKTFLVSLFLLLVFGCRQSAHKTVDRYPGGQTKTEYIYPNGRDTSAYICLVYYETGKLKHKTEISSGMFVGQKITFYENGKVQRIEELDRPTALDDARYDCKITNYRPDGTKQSRYRYKNNNIDGIATRYDSTGNIARMTEYVDGKINGKEIFYYPNGKTQSIAFISDDTLSGFRSFFKENGDTLKWFHGGDFGVNGMFYKKWLDDGRILTGSYGDTFRNYVIWRWFNKENKLLKKQTVRSKSGEYIAPE